MRNILAAIAALLLAIASLSACASGTEQLDSKSESDSLTDDGGDTADNADNSANSADAKPEPEPKPEPTTQKFGRWWTYENGVKIKVTRPEAYTPSEWAFGGEGYPHHVKFDITVVNGSKKPVDVSLSEVTVTTNGRVGESDLTDADNGVDISPNTSVMPGQRITWTAGAAVQSLQNIAVNATPNWDYVDAAFGSTN